MKTRLLTLTGKEQELMDILEREEYANSRELGNELNLEPEFVTKLVQNIRRKHRINQERTANPPTKRIYTTRYGYSIVVRPEYVVYEARLRMANGIGTLLNGSDVFKKAKKIASKSYKKLQIEYHPSVKKISQLVD
jgi:hypothetical protein